MSTYPGGSVVGRFARPPRRSRRGRPVDGWVELEARALLSLIATSTSVTSTSYAPVYGQPMTLTAAVAPVPATAAPSPTGSVTFFDNGGALGTVAVNPGARTAALVLSAPTLSVGRHSITAAYSGDANFAGGTSSPVTGVINTVVNGVASQNLAADAAGDVFYADNAGLLEEFVKATGSTRVIAAVNSASAVALDSTRNLLYYAEPSLNRVRVVNLGTLAVSAVAGAGPVGSSGDDGPALLARFSSPEGLAVDPARNLLYVADTFNNRVRVVNLNTGVIANFAGNGQGGYFDGSGSPTAAELNLPFGLSVDAAGDVFIADTFNNRVREVTASGAITTVAGDGSQDFAFAGDNGPATASGLFLPVGVAAGASGDLFLTDTYHNRVRAVNLATGVVTTVAGNGTAGSGGDGGPGPAAALNAPRGVAVDPAGDLFVGDNGNARVRALSTVTIQVSADATQVALAASTPAPAVGQPVTFTATVSPVTATSAAPTGAVTFLDGTTALGTGSLATSGGVTRAVFTTSSLAAGAHAVSASYAGDGNFLAAVTPGVLQVGTVATLAGTGAGGFAGDNSAATSAQVNAPQGLAFDAAGDVFFADALNNRVREVVKATGNVVTVAGNGAAGFYGDGLAATSASLNRPQAVAVDPARNILYVADTFNSRVRAVNLSTGVISTVAGLGFGGPGGNNIPASAANLAQPYGVAVDAAGNLYIADTLFNRVREVTAATGVITTVAGNGNLGFGGDGGPPLSATLDWPHGVAVDPAGDLFIADTFNGRVREVVKATGLITTVAGGGAQVRDNVPATSTYLFLPVSVAADAFGDLYIADTYDNRVRAVSLATGVVTTVAGTGAAGEAGDGGPGTAAQVNTPRGVAVDSLGNVVFSDAAGNRVRRLGLFYVN